MAKPKQKKPPIVKKTEITREEIKGVLGGAKFTLKEVTSHAHPQPWKAYRIEVDGLPEGIVTVTLDEADRDLYDRVIQVCRTRTFKGLPIIRGEV